MQPTLLRCVGSQQISYKMVSYKVVSFEVVSYDVVSYGACSGSDQEKIKKSAFELGKELSLRNKLFFREFRFEGLSIHEFFCFSRKFPDPIFAGFGSRMRRVVILSRDFFSNV